MVRLDDSVIGTSFNPKLERKRMNSNRIIEVTMEDAMDGTIGVCLACGMDAYGVEPDARNYKCEDCGKCEVFGIEEAALMGRIEIVG